MREFPLRYARRNLLIGRGGEAAALYRARTVSYPFLPVAEKWSQLGRLELFATLVGADFSLWRVQRSYPAERYAAELAATSTRPTPTRRVGGGSWRSRRTASATSTPTSPRSTSPSLSASPRAARSARSTAPAGGSRNWPGWAPPHRSRDRRWRRWRSPRSGSIAVSPEPSACAGRAPPSCNGCSAAARPEGSPSPSLRAPGSPTP